MTVAEVIELNAARDEISRLRAIVADLRKEAWDHLWEGLMMDHRMYEDETARLQYSGMLTPALRGEI